MHNLLRNNRRDKVQTVLCKQCCILYQPSTRWRHTTCMAKNTMDITVIKVTAAIDAMKLNK